MSGLCNALSQIYYHKICKSTDASAATLYMYSIAAIITLIPAVIYSQSLSLTKALIDIHSHTNLLLLLIILALTTISNQTFRGRGYAKVMNAAFIVPFLYLAIIFSGIFDWIFFDKLPDIWAALGATMIIISGFITFTVKLTTKHEENIL